MRIFKWESIDRYGTTQITTKAAGIEFVPGFVVFRDENYAIILAEPSSRIGAIREEFAA